MGPRKFVSYNREDLIWIIGPYIGLYLQLVPVPEVGLSDVVDVDAEGALHHVDLELSVGARERQASGGAIFVEQFWKSWTKQLFDKSH